MELRLAIALVGLLTVLTLVMGLLQGVVCGGLLSQDTWIWTYLGWIQGTVGGIAIFATYAIAASVQVVVLVGLVLRKSWARSMGFVLGGLYTCSGLFPFGLLLIVLLLRPAVAEAFGQTQS